MTSIFLNLIAECAVLAFPTVQVDDKQTQSYKTVDNQKLKIHTSKPPVAFDVVVNSFAAMVPSRELKSEISDSQVGLQARLMSQSMRKLTGAIARSKTCFPKKIAGDSDRIGR